MTETTVTLPFTVPNLFGGLAEGKGLAAASSELLTLEFILKETVLSVLKSGMKQIQIPRTELDLVQLKQGWFGSKVRIRVKSLRWLADLPGCDTGEVSLRIARSDRDRALEFVRFLGGQGP